MFIQGNPKWIGLAVLTAGVLTLVGCKEIANAVHTEKELASNTLFTPFSGRSPKHLDPTSSYSSDETPYTYSIYEPLYQYHFLKRPYELIGRAAAEVVKPTYLDKDGNVLPEDAPASSVAKSIYEIPIKKGIMYAPHPAFAKDGKGNYVNHNLSEEVIKNLHNPLDLPQKGSRELVAEDYVYAVKRLTNPRIISPVYGTMVNHIPGLADFAKQVRAKDQELRKGLSATDRDLPFLDFRELNLESVSAPESHLLRIEVNGKYPQFLNWLAMSFSLRFRGKQKSFIPKREWLKTIFL